MPAVAVERAAAEELLVQRYLGGFGPATPSDVARYAGWNITEAKAVLARLDLREDRDPDGAKLVDLPDAARPDGDTPAPVRFLSTFDALLLLGHAKRARIVPEEHREKVFAAKMPQSIPTFLVDGHVAGTWRYVEGRVVPTPFTPALARGSDGRSRRRPSASRPSTATADRPRRRGRPRTGATGPAKCQTGLRSGGLVLSAARRGGPSSSRRAGVARRRWGPGRPRAPRTRPRGTRPPPAAR